MESVEANLVDLKQRSIYPVRLSWLDGVIQRIERIKKACSTFLVPGFVDAHVHIESSMVTPGEFAKVAVTHGTVATVSDPHEIANVLGIRGVQFMLDEAAKVPLKFWFGAPSCVPATPFETAGGSINVQQTEWLLDQDEIHYLAEMMNYPGVIAGDRDVLAKLAAAKVRNLPIDGHAPAVRGQDAKDYFAAGILTDHECFTLEEAVEKLELGVRVQIREGSAARNFEELKSLIDRYPGQVMFCSDDKHPDELMIGHINQLCARAIESGCDVFNTLTAACVVPVQHYNMSVGQLNVGDCADFVELDSFETFGVRRTWIDGQCVSDDGKLNFETLPAEPINHFQATEKRFSDFIIRPEPGKRIRVIQAHDGLLTTTSQTHVPRVYENNVVSDPRNDILKLCVINRYADVPPAIGFVRGFGLHDGVIAGSVGHDSHNILAVGLTDEEIAVAVNAIVKCGGGLSCARDNVCEMLPLPVAGLMSLDTCAQVAAKYTQLDRMAKLQGCSLQSPYMTLSFLALLVIPSLKLSDQGLFDGDRFEFANLFVD